MNTTEFIQAVENRKVLVNGKFGMITKGDNDKIWFFGFGVTAQATELQASEKYDDQVIFSNVIEIAGAKILYPIFVIATDKWEVKE